MIESSIRHTSQLPIGYKAVSYGKNWSNRPLLFYNENFTGSYYKRILLYFLFPNLQYYSWNSKLQQDGTPPHYFVEERKFCDRKLTI